MFPSRLQLVMLPAFSSRGYPETALWNRHRTRWASIDLRIFGDTMEPLALIGQAGVIPMDQACQAFPKTIKNTCFIFLIFLNWAGHLDPTTHSPGSSDLGLFSWSYDNSTLPETNIAPENQWLKDEFPFGMAYFRGYVSFRVCISWCLCCFFVVPMLQSVSFFGSILDHQGKTKTAVFSLLEDRAQRSINKKRQSVLSDDQWMTSGWYFTTVHDTMKETFHRWFRIFSRKFHPRNLRKILLS